MGAFKLNLGGAPEGPGKNLFSAKVFLIKYNGFHSWYR